MAGLGADTDYGGDINDVYSQSYILAGFFEIYDNVDAWESV